MDSQFDFEDLGKIGSGSFAIVHKIRDVNTNKIYVKRMTPYKKEIEKYLETEMKLHKVFRANAPKYINYSLNEGYEEIKEESTVNKKYKIVKYAVLILPLCDSGDLGKYLSDVESIPEFEVRKYAFQVLTALQFCHSHDIMHRDLKLENVMLNKDEPDHQLTCYLCDFGTAKQTGETKTVLGSQAYMAPEINSSYMRLQQATEMQYSKSVDVWSFGMMMYNMLYGKLPFIDTSDFDEFDKTKKIALDQNSRRLSLAAISFIESCLQYDPKQRKTVEELLAHEFIAGTAIPYYYFPKLDETISKTMKLDTCKYFYTNEMNIQKKQEEEQWDANPECYSLYKWALTSKTLI